MELQYSQTLGNLMRLFAGETMARARYEYAAAAARAQGAPALAALFDYTSGQEKEHAQVLWDLLKSAGVEEAEAPGTYPVDLGSDVSSLLHRAADYEFKEADTVYPAFAAAARAEGFDPIADRLALLGEIERLHGERFARFASMWEGGSLFRGGADTVWICLNCGDVAAGEEPPASCPVCAHEKGFFVRMNASPFQ